MKVLWLVNFLFPDLASSLGKIPSHRGGWVTALAEALTDSKQIELAVASNTPNAQFSKKNLNGIQYYIIPTPKFHIRRKCLSSAMIRDYQRAVEDFRPDVIHVHGTEYFHGLLTGRDHLNCPSIISIQGIIDVCQKHYWGGISFNKLLSTRTLRDWVRMDGLIEQRYEWKRRATLEKEIFATNSAFLGRTIWDRAHTRRLNPKARYYHCDEMIRQPFHNAQWNINLIKRYSIFASSASYPLKGFHVLIKAAAILRNEFPDVTLRTPLANLYPTLTGIKRFWKNRRAMGYARYLTDLIRAEDLTEHIFSFPMLDAEGMANELKMAHVFALPSLIENSPNSLAEAMLVGTPSVASFVGGVPSMVQDGDSALLFPPGDEAVLAEQIRHVFLDDRLAQELSIRAREVWSCIAWSPAPP